MLLNSDGFANYMSAAGELLVPFIANTTPISKIITQQEAYYIRLNGEKTIQEISLSAVRKYNKLLNDLCRRHMLRIAEKKVIFLLAAVFSLFMTIFIGNRFNRLNLEVV